MRNGWMLVPALRKLVEVTDIELVLHQCAEHGGGQVRCPRYLHRLRWRVSPIGDGNTGWHFGHLLLRWRLVHKLVAPEDREGRHVRVVEQLTLIVADDNAHIGLDPLNHFPELVDRLLTGGMARLHLLR